MMIPGNITPKSSTLYLSNTTVVKSMSLGNIIEFHRLIDYVFYARISGNGVNL